MQISSAHPASSLSQASLGLGRRQLLGQELTKGKDQVLLWPFRLPGCHLCPTPAVIRAARLACPALAPSLQGSLCTPDRSPSSSQEWGASPFRRNLASPQF